jgi:hypothetical protein
VVLAVTKDDTPYEEEENNLPHRAQRVVLLISTRLYFSKLRFSWNKKNQSKMKKKNDLQHTSVISMAFFKRLEFSDAFIQRVDNERKVRDMKGTSEKRGNSEGINDCKIKSRERKR